MLASQVDDNNAPQMPAHTLSRPLNLCAHLHNLRKPTRPHDPNPKKHI